MRDAEVVWITYDTPVDADDRADVEFVVQRARALVDAADPSAVILVSSQLPVGSTRLLERVEPTGAHASPARPRTCGSATRSRCSRSPTGSSSGSGPTATATGSRSCSAPFSNRIEWMGVESAELVKHGVNAFLALSVAFANELAAIAERRRRRRHRGRARAEDREADRATGLPQAGCRIRRGHAGARRRLPDADRRARARADAPPVRGAREQRRAQAVGPADGRGARRHERHARRPRHRGLGARLQAGDGHAAPVERGRALPGARGRGSRRQGSRFGRAGRARRPRRRLHALLDADRGGARAPRRSSSRRTGRRTARSIRTVSWQRCARRSWSTRTAFSPRRSATVDGAALRQGREPSSVTAALAGTQRRSSPEGVTASGSRSHGRSSQPVLACSSAGATPRPSTAP